MSRFGIELSSPSCARLGQRRLEPRAGAGEVVDVFQPLTELAADPWAEDAVGRSRLRAESPFDQVE